MAGTYLLEVNLCLALVILLYRVAFQKLTFFAANRLYLLLGMIFCIVAPALKLPLLPGEWRASSVVVADFIPTYVPTGRITFDPTQLQGFHFSQILWIIYGCITIWHLYKLFADVFAVVRLIRKYPSRKLGNARLVFAGDEIPASSFFNYIFIHQNLSNESLRTCVAHELVHCRQAHTCDWLLVRFLSACCWFNPLMRFWREAITVNHEFIADEQAARQAGRFRYTHLLLNLSSSTQISTLHYFSYYGQIKSRIIMLHQTPSRAVNRLRFLAVVPLTALMLFLFSCERPGGETNSISEYLNKDLIGVWENMNRITINDNDGKTPRDFPERSGNVKVCLSKLELRADGHFEMRDAGNANQLAGTWQSNSAGNAIQLFCNNEKTGTSVISLELEGDENGSIAVWQHYPADEKLSAGHVFYEYKKL
ncbi:BlaR1 peptidase M56 [Dyadobacter sp. SG02]|uniref:M56 family metallopeptidase n=1 Tax=Dyadobacter sp. SG02 TaxID=1855291 RepID=UPI0008C8D98C|nr:M56 family metallopeptidase [Dyadobacter sp. SG02]SEJ82849.1 BlaR1 peptidase M56 [Dyadobacter sp. SG02]